MNAWKRFLTPGSTGGILVALVVVCLLFGAMSPRFFSPSNFSVILTQVSINALLAFGVSFVIISGGIDLSLGSLVAVCGVVAALMAQEPGISLCLSLPLTLAFGVLLGALNGGIVVSTKVPPFIVTLGTMTLGRGLALLISDGRPISGLQENFNYLGNGQFLGLGIPIYVLLISFVACHYLLSRTVFGRYVKAVGGNETAALVAGISVSKVKMGVYMLSGFFIALAAILLTARINTGQPNAGLGFELDAIAAVIIGGTSTKGGKGTMLGTFLGVLFLGVINNGLDLVNVSAYWQQVIMGGIIILAVVLDAYYQRFQSKT